jgi:hypothetical protein
MQRKFAPSASKRSEASSRSVVGYSKPRRSPDTAIGFRGLKREFGWSESTALRFMHVAKLSESVNLTDLNVALNALYRLAAPSTPAEVVEDVVAQGREGGPITYTSIVEATAARKIRVQRAYEERETILVPYYRHADQPPRESPTIAHVRGEAEDPARARIRAVAREVMRSLGANADALAIHQIGAIVATLTVAERYQFRKGIEAVDRLRAALDETQCRKVPDKLN